MRNNFFGNMDSIYFIGIGGVSMSALAKLMKNIGYKVGGSDSSESEYTEELEHMGIPVQTGIQNQSVKDYGIVVFTDAVKENNAQLKEARALDKLVLSRGELLREVSRLYKNVIAVAGCHGKTTCTAMLAHIFYCAQEKFTCHIGGRDSTFNNYYCNGDSYFITEACEYNKNFLKLKADTAVILNSDADHLECYGNADELKKSYIRFAEKAATAIHLYGDLPLNYGITFGFDDRADYYAKRIKNNGGKYSFVLYENSSESCKIELNVFGKHNVLNALAATAAARSCGIAFKDVAAGLNGFRGVERRFENIGKYQGANVIADYAHHPNEIRATLKTAATVTKGDIYVIFQPHTYSRTKNLFKQFRRALCYVNKLLIYKTFPAREYFDDAGSALTLSQSLKKSRYADCVRDIEYFLNGAGEGDTVLVLGAGDIYYTVKNLLAERNEINN